MILFYQKKTGKIFATMDGRVHDEKQLNCFIVDDQIDKEEIGKYIIGWIQKYNEKEKETDKIGYNLDQFKILEKFEDITPESPLDYKIINGKLQKC